VSDDPITLWRYRDLPEALVAESKLDAEGFECFLVDDNVIRLNWFWSNAFGGVRLCVREDEGEAALALLAEEIPAAFAAEEVGEEYQQPFCPNCGSRDVDFETVHRGVALSALWIFSLPVPIPADTWKCEDCGYAWKGEYV
jgi:hypothetical protein